MNKKIIAAAIAAAVAAPSAFAGNDTTLYGKIHMSIVGENDLWSVLDNSNRIGVKGSEDLGNGLKAIFQYEMGYQGADEIAAAPAQNNIFSARNSYIGMAGDFGQFRVGRHDTPAKVAFYAAGNERLGDSILDLNGAFGFDELRTTDAIAYISPSFSGVTVAAAIVPGETAAADGLADGISIGVMYAGNGLKAGLGHTDLEDIVGADASLTNVGASYTFGDFSVGAQYQDTEVGATEKEAWALTGSATFGNNQVVLLYGQAESGAAEPETYGIGLIHKLSKRTSAYVAYREGDDSAAVASNWVGNGGTTDPDDAFGIGMIHSF